MNHSRAGLLGIVLGLALSLAAAAQTPPPGPGPYKIVRAISGDDVFWDYATIVPEEHRLYLAREDGISVLDLATGKLTPVFVPG